MSKNASSTFNCCVILIYHIYAHSLCLCITFKQFSQHYPRHAIPSLPMSCTNLNLLFGCKLHQVQPLWKQLHWSHFLCWHWCQASFLFYFDCIERLHYSPPHNPELLKAWMSLEFQGLFLLRCLCEQTNARRGQCCTHTGKSWYRGESSAGQPLQISPPCLMYMEQKSWWRREGGSEWKCYGKKKTRLALIS